MPGKEYEQYERACAKIREDNTKLMADFEQWLAKKGLGEKTIREHVQNVDFYVNTFLLYEEAIPASKGATRVSSFLGDWFIRKALWASRSSIRESAASLKKFYAFMPEWLEAVEDCDDPGSDPLERWGL